MIVGEASYKLSEETRQRVTGVRWLDIIRMRHRLVHDYGNISYEVVWDTATNHLEQLIRAIEPLLPRR